jgi:YD repeat-containing protein
LTVDDMIGRGDLERVESDAAASEGAIEEARRHLESARSISASDPNGAYQLAYDGARKIVAAHMRRNGVRVRKGEGTHALTARYAGEALDTGLGKRLDAMRRRRNRSEYGTAFFSNEEVSEAVATAEALLGLVEHG